MGIDRGAELRALHVAGRPFILANVWDAGSARMLVARGARALGTSSAAHAFTLGRPDLGQVTRDEALAHAEQLVASVPVPVSGDFEDGFGADPEVVAETVRLAAEVGLAGISIEDTDLPGTEPYRFESAVTRIEAAVDAARSLPGDFVLLARADGVMHRSYDLAEGIRRIKAFEKVGADAVYVPMPPGVDGLAEVCRSVTAPVNALAAGSFTKLSYDRFAEIGVARISLGSSLARLVHRTIDDTAKALFEDGDFSLLADGMSGEDVDSLLIDPGHLGEAGRS